MLDYIVIKGIKYSYFSLEKKSEGGRYSKQEAVRLLRDAGIKVNISHAYTPFVGQYGLCIEYRFADRAEELPFN